MLGFDAKVVNDRNASGSLKAKRNLVASNMLIDFFLKSRMSWLVMASKVS